MYRAKLDANRVYWGVEQVDEPAAFNTDTGEGDFAVPANCDLKAGAYRLDPPGDGNEVWHFQPLEKQQRPAAPAVPSFEAALYAFIKHGADHADVAAWVTHYESTLDAQ